MTRIASDMVATMNDKTGCCCDQRIPKYMSIGRDPYQPLADIPAPFSSARATFIRWLPLVLVLCGVAALVASRWM